MVSPRVRSGRAPSLARVGGRLVCDECASVRTLAPSPSFARSPAHGSERPPTAQPAHAYANDACRARALSSPLRARGGAGAWGSRAWSWRQSCAHSRPTRTQTRRQSLRARAGKDTRAEDGDATARPLQARPRSHGAARRPSAVTLASLLRFPSPPPPRTSRFRLGDGGGGHRVRRRKRQHRPAGRQPAARNAILHGEEREDEEGRHRVTSPRSNKVTPTPSRR